VTTSLHWQQRVGSQRNWAWRGWQTRYTYVRSQLSDSPLNTPVLLLHGFGASIGHWRHNLEVLGEHHTVYALDMLGFGASQKAQIDYKIDLWVEQVYDFWRTFIREPVVLVGNSIGSLVCLAAAANYPQMVKGIVMISLPDMSARDDAIPKLLRPLVAGCERLVASPLIIKTLFYLVRRPSIVRKWAAIAYANPTAVSDELVEIFAGPAQDRGAVAAFYAILRGMMGADFGPSAKNVLPSLEIPILLLWGREDRMIPHKLSRRFIDLNPKLRLVEIENAGHCPHDECPEIVNQILLQWLDSEFPISKLEIKMSAKPS
jgi:haloalkane dehalogenase